MTARFHPLRVADRREETPDAISLAFDIPPELAAAYRFRPGQYLTLRATIGGEELRRSYSICSLPEDGELRIAIRHLPGGRFSGWAHAALHPGAEVEAMTPTGRFGPAMPPPPGETHLAIAAGSGITPVLPILRSLLAEPTARAVLLYGNRSSATALFAGALGELKDRYPGRLALFHILSREEQDLPVLHGRLDPARVRRLIAAALGGAVPDRAWICGPEGLAESLIPLLRETGLDDAAIHVERFVSAAQGRPAAASPAPIPAPDAPGVPAALILDGRRRSFTVAPEETVLEAARRAGIDVPYACKGGLCSTCRARIVGGEVAMAVNYALEPWETEAGYVLTCQSRVVTGPLLVDYDQT